MKSDVLEILDEVYEQAIDKEGVDSFIRESVNSISPKTRQKAKELVRKVRFMKTLQFEITFIDLAD